VTKSPSIDEMLTIDPTAPAHRFDHRLDADERSELVDLEDLPNRLDRGVGDRGQMQDRRC
jgi:hypothetical protein